MTNNDSPKNFRIEQPAPPSQDHSGARPSDRARPAPTKPPDASAPTCNFPVKTGRTGRAKTQFQPGVSGNPRGRAIASGEITPAEAERLTRVLESRRRAFETIELAHRLDLIEARLEKQ
jgi:hypothetical protein